MEDFYWEGEGLEDPGRLQTLRAPIKPGCLAQEGTPGTRTGQDSTHYEGGRGIVHLSNGRVQSCPSFACSLA